MNIATWKSLSDADQKDSVTEDGKTKILDYTVQRSALPPRNPPHGQRSARTHESNATLNVTFDDDPPPIEASTTTLLQLYLISATNCNRVVKTDRS
jgi:hypothetical protein